MGFPLTCTVSATVNLALLQLHVNVSV